MTPIPQTPPASGLQSLIEKAKGDLAQRLSITAAEINVTETRDVTWPDASIGCPQEGMVYAQVLTPGYLILLEYANNQYEYHTGKGTAVTYCANPTPPIISEPFNT